MNAQKCLFCGIITKEYPSQLKYENEYIYAFEDINIQREKYREHILVIPKIHIESLNAISTSLEHRYYQYMHLALFEITELLQAKAFSIHINSGRAAGQQIGHLHMHIKIPKDGI